MIFMIRCFEIVVVCNFLWFLVGLSDGFLVFLISACSDTSTFFLQLSSGYLAAVTELLSLSLFDLSERLDLRTLAMKVQLSSSGFASLSISYILTL